MIDIRLFEDNNYFFKSSIHFSNNTALIGVSAIYGGWVDWSVDDNGIITYNPIMSTIINLQGNDDIASSSLRACLCFDGSLIAQLLNTIPASIQVKLSLWTQLW